jgi:hypothetical protein
VSPIDCSFMICSCSAASILFCLLGVYARVWHDILLWLEDKILLFSDSSSSSTMDSGGKSRRLSYILFSHVHCCLVYSPDEITINDYALPYGTKVENSENIS